jgi:hypothetical protein
MRAGNDFHTTNGLDAAANAGGGRKFGHDTGGNGANTVC